jgi:hypothetical protein
MENATTGRSQAGDVGGALENRVRVTSRRRASRRETTVGRCSEGGRDGGEGDHPLEF